jgi:hypothetical protein
MKSGSATSDHESRLFHDEFAIKPPIFDHIDIVGGREKLYKSIVAAPVANKEKPIHKPESRNVNRITIIKINKVKGSEII